MLSTTTKPYNPNKKQSLDADWDKLDLCSFLQNINSINIDKNDISYTGNDYDKATKREIVAEIIRTINATHYNSLLGMKDIINYNNNILKITKSRNKSIDSCNKQIKLLNEKIKRFEFLLVQAADLLPDPQSFAQQQTTQQIKKISNILDFTSCNDQTFTEDDFKFHDDIKSNFHEIPININQTRPELNINITNDTINTSETNNKNESCTDESLSKIQLKPLPPKQSQPQHTQNASAFALGPIGGATNIENIEQASHEQNLQCVTAEIVNTEPNEPVTQNPTVYLRKIKNNEIKSPKQTIKLKKASKKKKTKNNKKNNKKKVKRKKHTKPKRQKQKKSNIKQKENILNMDKINDVIKNYEFTYDQYQDFMNQRVSHRLGLSAYDYYEEICGPITDEKIKEWSSVYHSN